MKRHRAGAGVFGRTALEVARKAFALLAAGGFLMAMPVQAQATASIRVEWSVVEANCRSTPTLQVVTNPLLRRGTVVHDGAFGALRALGADDVRYAVWFPYPRLAVAELEPPNATTTSWDFTTIDPMTIDFFRATEGHPAILSFSTIPQWMFKTPKPVPYPANPDEVDWSYNQGTELRDPSMKELAGYYARLVSWYTRGGFRDENGRDHASGYHYRIPYWEVFNEIEGEHHMTPKAYTDRYDAVVQAVRAVSPGTKFVGLALASPKTDMAYFNYFLDPKNHQRGVPLDMISYHFYAQPKAGETADNWQFTLFAQADDFLHTVHKVEAIRRKLSPMTRTTIDELGVILPNDNSPGDPDKRIPPIYWNAAGAMYAYLYLELSKLGIEMIGESQLVGYPSQYPSVSLIDWKNGRPNARFWVLKLLKDNLGPGVSLMATYWGASGAPNPDLEAQAYRTQTGRKLLLINKRNAPETVTLPDEALGGRLDLVDASTGEHPPRSTTVNATKLTLSPFAVAVVQLKP